MGDLGINGWNLIVQIIAFLLFIGLFWKFALGPITSTLDARRDRVQESIAEAERVRQELAASRAQNEQIMAEARQEAQGLIANAREIRDQTIARSNEEAQARADQIIAQAQEEITAMTARARAELRQEIADLAVTAAGKIVRANLDRQAQTRLIEETLAEAGAGGNGSTPSSRGTRR